MNSLIEVEASTQKRVLFLSGDMKLGGGAVFVLNVCEGLNQILGRWQGFTGVFTEYGEVGEQILSRNIPMLGPFHGKLLHEDYIERMYSECSQLRPGAVVANLGGSAFDFLRFVPESVLRVAVIHSDDECVYRQVERYLPWIDVVVGVSARNCEVMRKRLGNHDVPVHQVACGVPISESRPREIRRNGALRVLYLGRVVEQQKRAGLLARIIRRSLDADETIIWTIAGDGPDLNRLQQSLADAPARVTFLGSVAYDRVPALIDDHDVYFLCSDFEGLPLSMLEAMAGGVVPVVSDLPSGISEVVNEHNGIRVAIDDEDAYLNALLDLARFPDKVSRLANQATDDVRESYSVEAMAERWSKLLNQHASQSNLEWPSGCVASAPPELQSRWRNHPRLRWLRKWIKSLHHLS